MTKNQISSYQNHDCSPSRLNLLVQRVDQELLPAIQIKSITPHNPVEVHSVPAPWQLLGVGNYLSLLYLIKR